MSKSSDRKGQLEKINDKKMYFVRNIEELKDEKVENYVTECEVIVDAHIVGELTYGPYDFIIWEFSNKQHGEERKLILRIREASPPENYEPHKSAKKLGFYHGGGIADELVALASLLLRRRFKLGSIVRRDDRPTLIKMGEGIVIDKPLITGKSNLADLKRGLNLVEKLDGKYHQKFILAVRLYHLALQLIEAYPDLAYLNLISAIETLCRDTEVECPTLSELDTKLSEHVDSIDNKELRENIKQGILKRERFIKRRFVAFIMKHIEDTFWEEEPRTEEQKAVIGNFGSIKKGELSEFLNRIYDQRSKTLHTGEPLLPPHPSPHAGEDIDFSLGRSVGEKKWEPKDYLPYPHFFERLVNHVLKNFIKRNQEKEKVVTPTGK